MNSRNAYDICLNSLRSSVLEEFKIKQPTGTVILLQSAALIMLFVKINFICINLLKSSKTVKWRKEKNKINLL